MTAQEIRVPVSGGEIVGHVHGDHGPDLILISSVGLGELFWWRTAEVLSENARVVTLAIRGHGRSTCDVIEERPEETLRDIAAVADHVGMKRPAVIGLEFGAAVAALAVALMPERFAALGVVDAPLIHPVDEYADLVSIFEDHELQRVLAERGGLGAHGPDAKSMKAFLDEWSQKMAADWNGRTPDAESAREALSNDIVVEPSGAWVRRPTIETCTTLADVPDDFFAQPGRELLDAMSVPVWVVGLTKGHYYLGFDDFQKHAAGRDSWDVRQVEGGSELFHDGTLAGVIGKLLEALPA